MNPEYLAHHGILGQKWGVRRYQNPNGSLTEQGKRRYKVGEADKKKQAKGYQRRLNDTEKYVATNTAALKKAETNKRIADQRGMTTRSRELSNEQRQYKKNIKAGKAEINNLVSSLNRKGFTVANSDHKYRTQVINNGREHIHAATIAGQYGGIVGSIIGTAIDHNNANLVGPSWQEGTRHKVYVNK